MNENGMRLGAMALRGVAFLGDKSLDARMNVKPVFASLVHHGDVS
jgi:hypothetical protein